MTDLMIFLIFKILCLISGFLVVFLGYQLFKLGVYGNAGDLEIDYDNIKLLLKKSAPGTVFLFFGGFIIIATIYKGLEIEGETITITAYEPSLIDHRGFVGFSEPPYILSNIEATGNGLILDEALFLKQEPQENFNELTASFDNFDTSKDLDDRLFLNEFIFFAEEEKEEENIY